MAKSNILHIHALNHLVSGHEAVTFLLYVDIYTRYHHDMASNRTLSLKLNPTIIMLCSLAMERENFDYMINKERISNLFKRAYNPRNARDSSL